jgi:outer membrane protein
MLKSKFAAFAAIILAAAASVASAQQATQAGVGAAIPDGKIAVLNSQAFSGSILELKQKYDQVESQFKDRYAKLQQIETQLKTMESDLKTKQGVLAADKYQQLQIDFEDLKKKGQRDFEDLKNDYNKTVDTATRPVRDKLYQFIQAYSAQRGIVLIIDLAGAAQSGTLAYWNPGSDVTEDFINEYNRANPVAGAPAPAAAKPAPTPVKPAAKP